MDDRRDTENDNAHLVPDYAAFEMRQIPPQGWWRDFIGALKERPTNDILAILAVLCGFALAWRVEPNELPQLVARGAYFAAGLVAAILLKGRNAETAKNSFHDTIEPRHARGGSRKARATQE